MSAARTPTPEGGALSADELIRAVRWAIKDAKRHGKGPPQVSFGLHVAESIIAAIRSEKRAEVSAAVRSHDALVAALDEQREFLASLHTTYRHDGRLAARVIAHIAAIDAALKAAKGEA